MAYVTPVLRRQATCLPGRGAGYTSPLRPAAGAAGPSRLPAARRGTRQSGATSETVGRMNPVERVIRRVDAAQQRHRASAFAFGVIKKYGDDNGGVLVSNLAHSAFVSMFPLLLILFTILGLIAAGDPGLRHQVINDISQQVPVIGRQLSGNVGKLRRSSVIGLIVGILALTWGAMGLAQAGLFTMSQVWNLPGPARVAYFPRLGRALLFLGVLSLGVLITTLLAALDTYTSSGPGLFALRELAAAAANSLMYFAGFRVLTPKAVRARQLLPGAIAGGVAWTLLQYLGTLLLHHYLNDYSVYGIFGTVLGLLAWVYISMEIVVYAAELNVVLSRRLWPRSIVQPPLTDADLVVLADQALMNQRRDDQQVTVSYENPSVSFDSPPTPPPPAPDEPRTEAGDVLPAAEKQGDAGEAQQADGARADGTPAGGGPAGGA